MQSLWHTQMSLIVAIAWVVAFVGLQAMYVSTVLMPIMSVACWSLILYFSIERCRLRIRASRQAASVAATSPKARPFLESLEGFERWRVRSQLSR